jgi:hypothetical protein
MTSRKLLTHSVAKEKHPLGHSSVKNVNHGLHSVEPQPNLVIEQPVESHRSLRQ